MPAKKKTDTVDADVGGSWIQERCTTADLSKLFGVSPRTIRDLKTRGIIFSASPGSRDFNTIKSIHGYLTHLREGAAGRASGETSLVDERAQTERVNRQIQEIKLAEMQGKMIPVDVSEQAWGAFAAAVKAAFLAFPSRLRQNIPHMTAHDAQTAKELARDVLRDLAEEAEATIVGIDPDKVSK